MPRRSRHTRRGAGRSGSGASATTRLAELAAAGDERAFEALYDRHHRALLGFCRPMLRSHEEAEDALQQTFLRAHRALAARGAPPELRPWLFTIARNCSLTMLSSRRPQADADAEVASAVGLGEQVQVRADLRALVADVGRLPEEQRAALVLAEVGDLSHDQIAEVIGVRPGKVKALIHQARTTLIAEREARETPCAVIREQLATAQGGALRRGPLRRHLRGCEPCRAYRTAVGDQRRALALALPVTPSLGLKAAVLGSASAAGGAAAGTAALTSGFAAKVVAGALLLGGGAGGGVAIVDRADPDPRPAPAAAKAAAEPPAPSTPPRVASVGATGEADRAKRSAKKRSSRRAARRRAARRGLAKGKTRPPAQAAAPKHADRPARVKAPKAAKLAKPLKPARRTKPAKPAKPPKPAKPVKPLKAATSVKAAKPVKAAQPAKPAKPAKSAKG